MTLPSLANEIAPSFRQQVEFGDKLRGLDVTEGATRPERRDGRESEVWRLSWRTRLAADFRSFLTFFYSVGYGKAFQYDIDGAGARVWRFVPNSFQSQCEHGTVDWSVAIAYWPGVENA